MAAQTNWRDSLTSYHVPRPGLFAPAQQEITETPTTAPTGTPVSESVTITYEYDALHRLTSATYSNGTSFHYTYDPAGNVLEYVYTIGGQTKTITYTYDAANQLLTATQDSVVWHYTYDGNGSLVQSTPGDPSTGSGTASGARRYTYNTAGFLVKVETHNGTDWQNQAEMAYNGLGNRLEMTGYADGQSVTTQYELDNGRVLSASASDPSAGSGQALTTFYLYGLGPIGELTTTWSYGLPDGANTQRQLVDASGEVTLTSSYTPWGDTLEVHGTGNFTYGYFGGIMDAATGLIYVGNGQYYDPETGRFLTRDAKPNQNNPYTPVDPTSALFAPLALLAMVFGRKKSRGKWNNLIILLVLGVSVGAGLVACGGGNVTVSSDNVTATATWTPIPQTQNYQLEITATTDQGTFTATAILTPTETPIPCPPPASGSNDDMLKSYGATFEGNWPEAFKAYVVLAVQTLAERLGAELGTCETAAFQNDYGNKENGYHGFAGGKEDWQFAVQVIESAGEIWADMFLGWTFKNLGSFREDYMEDEIPDSLPIRC